MTTASEEIPVPGGSTRAAPLPAAKRLVPRDAATLVVVDRSGRTPRVLMGRRRPDQVFLPGTYVFPGGRVDVADRALARALHSSPAALADARLLEVAMKGRPSPLRATALALAAVRETYEETGFVIGERAGKDAPAGAGSWRSFQAQGFHPDLSRLTFFARAITPPGRTRRYDTRFFAVDAEALAHRIEGGDGELLDIGWHTIAAARALNLPNITRVVIEDLVAWLEGPQSGAPTTVPFYFHRRGRFERTCLSTDDSPA